ncbi:MAG: hypothetical protein JXA38_03940 [Methanosarcinaceae archaeon]|nr:hypothetical protein [Methanosarcinaceae archaeon]
MIEKNPEKSLNKGILQVLLDQLKKELGNSVLNAKVEDVRIGLAYTGVKLTGGYGGVACTPTYDFSEYSVCPVCPFLHNSGEIAGTTVAEGLKLSLSNNILDAAVGVAVINAASQMVFELRPEKYIFSSVDVLDLIRNEDKVSMIGYFKPLIPKILEKTENFHVVEKKNVFDERVKIVPEEMSTTVLPESDIIIISGSTLVNKTIDDLLKYKGNARDVVLLGPTASMVPQPLFERGVTAVMGVKINDVDKMLKIVSEAGGTKDLHASCAEKKSFSR